MKQGTGKRIGAVLTGALFLWVSASSALKRATAPEYCQTPEYFGICDPYVPGTMLASRGDGRPLLIVGTWPGGPAERAGVCPGDQLVAADGVLAAESTYDQMLHAVVSAQQGVVNLTVLRGGVELRFQIRRVRESELAARYHQKFALLKSEGTLVPRLVPSYQHSAGLDALDEFEERIDARYGFKWVGNVAVPNAADETQVRKVRDLIDQGSARIVAVMPLADKNGDSLGFDSLFLRNPEELLVVAVWPDSPAHRGGLLPGDEVIEINSHPTHGFSLAEIQEMLQHSGKSPAVTLKIARRGALLTTSVPFQNVREFLEGSYHMPLPGEIRRAAQTYRYGVRILLPEYPKEVAVETVEYPSPAFDAGLEVGDMVKSVNREPVERISRQQLQDLLLPSSASTLHMAVLRGRKRLSFKIQAITYEVALKKIGRKLKGDMPVPLRCW